jgi:hypothetical protein
MPFWLLFALLANEGKTMEERRTVTVGMVTAALAAVGEHEVSLSSMRRREVTKMIQAALDWMEARDNQQHLQS